MTEHVHEWVWNNDLVIPFICSERDCRRFLDHDQSELRLNATEKLSADQAKDISADIRLRDYAKFAEQWRDKYSEKLYNAALSYANVLDGK